MVQSLLLRLKQLTKRCYFISGRHVWLSNLQGNLQQSQVSSNLSVSAISKGQEIEV